MPTLFFVLAIPSFFFFFLHREFATNIKILQISELHAFLHEIEDALEKNVTTGRGGGGGGTEGGLILYNGNYGVGAYGMDWVHNKEAELSLGTS